MKIRILRELGDVGVITDCKPTISSADIYVLIIGASGGTLTVGERSYPVKPSGEVIFPEWELTLGEKKVTYTDGDRIYDCGKLTKNGRFLKVENLTDKLIIDCAVSLAAQREEIKGLRDELDVLKKQYGINIVGG